MGVHAMVLGVGHLFVSGTSSGRGRGQDGHSAGDATRTILHVGQEEVDLLLPRGFVASHGDHDSL